MDGPDKHNGQADMSVCPLDFDTKGVHCTASDVTNKIWHIFPRSINWSW